MTQAQMITVDEGTIPVQIRVETLKSFDTKTVPSRFKKVGLDSGHYVWGYANVADETDSEGDRIERAAMAEALKTITKKPYNKLFLVHDYQTIAVGKIVHAEMDGDHPVILAKLNENLNNFEEIWKSIQEEYLDSFSIGGSFTKVVTEYDEKEDRYVNTVKELILREVSLTSIPAHPGASVLGAFKKTLEIVKKTNQGMEDSTMGEEEQNKTKNQEEGKQTQAPEGQAANKSEGQEAQANSNEGSQEANKSEGDDNVQAEILSLLKKQGEKLEALEKKLEQKEEDGEEDDDHDDGEEDEGKSAPEGQGEPARKSKGSDKHKQKFANQSDNKQGQSAAQKSGQFMNWLKGDQ